MDIDTTYNSYGDTLTFNDEEMQSRLFGRYLEDYTLWPDGFYSGHKTSFDENYYHFINQIFNVNTDNDEELYWISGISKNGQNIIYVKDITDTTNFYNGQYHPCRIRENYCDQGHYANITSYHPDGFINQFVHSMHVYKTNYIYNYEYTPNSETSNCGLPSGSYSRANEKMIIGVIAKNSDNIYDFFIWGPDYLYYKLAQPLTEFSIGNGNIYERNNLFEITNDGNVYYASGQKNLFELEQYIKNIENNLGQNITNIENDSYLSSQLYNQGKTEFINNYSDFYEYYSEYNTLIIPINNKISSPFIVNDANIMKYTHEEYGPQNKDIILFINENESNYLKKTIIIDTNYFRGNNNPYVFFISSKNGNDLKYNICINSIDDKENTYRITDINEYFVMELYQHNSIKYMYKIDIEIMNNICFINTKGYFQNGNYIQN